MILSCLGCLGTYNITRRLVEIANATQAFEPIPPACAVGTFNEYLLCSVASGDAGERLEMRLRETDVRLEQQLVCARTSFSILRRLSLWARLAASPTRQRLRCQLLHPDPLQRQASRDPSQHFSPVPAHVLAPSQEH